MREGLALELSELRVPASKRDAQMFGGLQGPIAYSRTINRLQASFENPRSRALSVDF